eukprot:SAG11_NODE_2614_length_3170_cov_2.584500_2_plen_67_part_00
MEDDAPAVLADRPPKRMAPMPESWRLIDLSDILHKQGVLHQVFESYRIDGKVCVTELSNSSLPVNL